jgi:hypothetical protein
MKDGPRGYRDLITASAAFPQLRSCESVGLAATAFRAVGLTSVVGPSDLVPNKIVRGGFTAVFFLQCMGAIRVQNIQLNGD